MELSAEWIGVGVAILGVGVTIGIWAHAQLVARRNSMPIIRSDWDTSETGHVAEIAVVNRLDEDLIISMAECKSRFVETSYEMDTEGSIASSSRKTVASPLSFEWVVPPLGTGREAFWIDGNSTPLWIRITVSSSNRTLRAKRLVVTPSQTP